MNHHHESGPMSRELLGKVVDEVFGGAIEDASVIEEIYAVIIREQSSSPETHVSVRDVLIQLIETMRRNTDEDEPEFFTKKGASLVKAYAFSLDTIIGNPVWFSKLNKTAAGTDLSSDTPPPQTHLVGAEASVHELTAGFGHRWPEDYAAQIVKAVLAATGGTLVPAGWQWQMRNPASQDWSDWRDGRARFGPDVGFQWREREIYAVAFTDTNPEARFIEDAENACPHCGGSGHKDDVVPSTPAAYTSQDQLDRMAENPSGNYVMWGEPIPHHPDIPLYRHPSPQSNKLAVGLSEAIDYAKAEQFFTDYFVKNYPGPDTVIFDPKWHAPKLFAVALRCLRSATAPEGER